MTQRTNTAFIITLISSLIIVMAVVFFISQFEVYKKTNYKASGEALRNRYLALDNWIRAEEHPLIIRTSARVSDIIESTASTALLWSSSFNWKNSDTLAQTIYAGKHIVVFIDDMGNEDLDAFLDEFGVQYRIFEGFLQSSEETNEEDEADDSDGDDALDKVVFDEEVYLHVEDETDADIIIDEHDEALLVTIQHGKGSLTVTGIPCFMYWDYLRDEHNAAMSWRLSGELDNNKRGLLFVRNSLSSGLKAHDDVVPSLWEQYAHKESAALGVSALFVVIIGFWMCFPSFGKLKKERCLPGAPIEERFRTEARFLKKYHALSVYNDVVNDSRN